jgi:sulfide dehydrogenase cytochrome subunit
MKYSGKNSVSLALKTAVTWGLMVAFLLPCRLGNAEEKPLAQAIAWNCQSCHQTESGSAEAGIPDLSDLTRRQLYQSLLDFKYQTSNATLMPRLVKGFSDQELKAVAELLAP